MQNAMVAWSVSSIWTSEQYPVEPRRQEDERKEHEFLTTSKDKQAVQSRAGWHAPRFRTLVCACPLSCPVRSSRKAPTSPPLCLALAGTLAYPQPWERPAPSPPSTMHYGARKILTHPTRLGVQRGLTLLSRWILKLATGPLYAPLKASTYLRLEENLQPATATTIL